jgi:hypothetical protein
MSKDKGSKNIKKSPNLAGNKAQSDYQAGKTKSAKIEIVTTSKKK